MAKVIITGGTGFVGNNLLPILAETAHEYFILDINKFDAGYKNIQVIQCNLLNESEINAIFSNIKATHLLHMAWGMSPSNYNLDINFDWLKASMNLLEAFKNNGGERAVITGSGVEYNWDYGFCTEDKTPISHETLYGSTKNILRQFAQSFCKQHNISLAWPRLFFLYGAFEHPDRLVSHIITSLLKGNNATILNGEVYRDYFYIKDTCNVLMKLIDHEFEGVLNVSSGVPTRLGEIGELIAAIIGKPELLEIKKPLQVKRRVVYANTEKLITSFGYKPEFSLEEGFTETINWWKENL